MKKFYLFAAIALAASATMSAKELSFYVQGERLRRVPAFLQTALK